ncbi:MAG TPA: oxygen-independent coproporphyrinogen III oxidase [Xanthomonadaceae bacterium]|nr:oxygen-independent coproporphyrinogen III oxidase [Xanthomonadaceae bacterium]
MTTANVIFDRELLARCDRPGPRYTSYPTAPHFHSGFGADQFRMHVRRSNEPPIPAPVSVYVHVPFCFSPCFYCGCNRIITRDYGRAEAYLARLYREIDLVAPLVDRDRDVVQLHFGGGTPNFLESADLGELIETIGRHFHFSSRADRDFSIEIDPRTVDPDAIRSLAGFGLNRASFGVQDFDPDVQRAVNRVQSVQQTREVIDACREAGMRSVNVDLIYGLPKQTREGFARTLDTVVGMRPDRLAVYSYAHLPEMFRGQTRIRAEDLPDPAAKLGLLELAVERLGAAGYVYIGMDHFALPGDELARAQHHGALHRNFMGYTTHADCDLIGMGVSAISRIGDAYAQNHKDLPHYQAALDAGELPIARGLALSADDIVRADLIDELMCNAAVDIVAFEDRHAIDFHDYFASSLAQVQPLVQDGLVTIEPGRIEATARGRLLLRIIAMCFDHYLEQPAAPVARYSRAI